MGNWSRGPSEEGCWPPCLSGEGACSGHSYSEKAVPWVGPAAGLQVSDVQGRIGSGVPDKRTGLGAQQWVRPARSAHQ